jgi:hypothetical protein
VDVVPDVKYRFCPENVVIPEIVVLPEIVMSFTMNVFAIFKLPFTERSLVTNWRFAGLLFFTASENPCSSKFIFAG